MSFTYIPFVVMLRDAAQRMKFDPADILISHGGASLFFGYRIETDDIDVAVPPEYWGKLVAAGATVVTHPATDTYPEVTLLQHLGVEWHLDEAPLRKRFLHESGFSVTTKEQLLEDRIALNRPKDQEDIRIIREEFHGMQCFEESDARIITQLERSLKGLTSLRVVTILGLALAQVTSLKNLGNTPELVGFDLAYAAVRLGCKAKRKEWLDGWYIVQMPDEDLDVPAQKIFLKMPNTPLRVYMCSHWDINANDWIIQWSDSDVDTFAAHGADGPPSTNAG